MVPIDRTVCDSGPEAATHRVMMPRIAVLPGIVLCIAVTLAAMLLQMVEADLLGRAWLEALVLAILLGTAIRTFWTPGARWTAGIDFSARTLLEIAVCLLGASVSAATIVQAGPGLFAGIAIVVIVAIGAGYGIGRLLGLPMRMALLIACGNAICGNSAIAAVAPAIGADGEDIAASIAFTAILGVVVVIGLPMLISVLSLSHLQFGVLAGLTVYAVPQVIAATTPIGAAAVQIGTLVKLVRVLMLGPVVLGLSLLTQKRGNALPFHRLVPWFIIGFLALAGLRSAGLVPQLALGPIGATADRLTVISMAALGLGTDLRAIAGAGVRVTVAVCLSLVLLGGISLGLIWGLGIG